MRVITAIFIAAILLAEFTLEHLSLARAFALVGVAAVACAMTIRDLALQTRRRHICICRERCRFNLGASRNLLDALHLLLDQGLQGPNLRFGTAIRITALLLALLVLADLAVAVDGAFLGPVALVEAVELHRMAAPACR